MTAGPAGCPRLDGHLVDRARARVRAEDPDHRPRGWQAEQLPTGFARADEVRDGNRPPDDSHPRAVPSRDLVGEEQALRERSRKPVREPEMSVGLGQRRWDSAKACGEHHRPGDVAAGAEHDVGPAAGEDPQAVRGGGRRAPGGADLRRARLPRQPRDRKGVEREARLRHQPRLDAVWRAGERHRQSAFAKRFAHRERGPDVTGRSPGRDHARELRRRAHSPRC